MSNLTNQPISQSFVSLLNFEGQNSGSLTTLQTIQDGYGVNTALQLSQTAVNITGSLTLNGSPIGSGSSGTSGTAGSSGTSGQSGSNGSSGTSGSSGSNGANGASFYQHYNGDTWTVNHNLGTPYPVVAVYDDNGFVLNPGSIQTTSPNQVVISGGVSSGWASVTTGQGSSGTSGTNGQAGSNGSSGTSGQNGSSGTSGTTGATGATGASGSSGTSGTSATGGNAFPYTGSAQITGSLGVTGSVRITNGLTITGALNVTNGATFAQGVNMASIYNIPAYGDLQISSAAGLRLLSTNPINIVCTSGSLSGSINLSGSIIPGGDLKYQLGAPGFNWKHLYVGSGSIYMNENRVMGLDPSSNNLQLFAPDQNNNITLNNNLFVASNDTGSFYGGAQITYLGNGVSGSTTHIYSGQTHAIETNGSLQFNNQIYGGDTGSAGSFQFNLANGGGHYLNDLNHPSGAFVHYDTTQDPANPSSTLSLYHTTHVINNGGFSVSGSNSFVEVNTHNNIDLNAEGSQNLYSNYYTNIKSEGSILVSGNTVNIDGGTGGINLSGSALLFNGSPFTGGSSGSSGTSGESYNQSLNTTDAVTFDTVSSTNNGNGTNFKVGDDGWIGDINISNTIQVKGQEDANQGYIQFGQYDSTTNRVGSDGTNLLLNTTGTINLNQTTNISGSLNISTGSIYMNGPTGSANAISFPFAVDGTTYGSTEIFQDNNGSMVLAPLGGVFLTGSAGALTIPGNGYPAIAMGIDTNGNYTGTYFGGITQYVSSSLMSFYAGGFVQDFLQDTDTGNVLGTAFSTFNTQDGSVSANFFGPGTGSNVVNGTNDNVVFQIPNSGSTLTIYRNTVISGTSATSNGFVMAQLPGTQSIPNGVDTIVEYTAEIDTNDWWNSGSHQFEPNVAGYYEVTAYVNWAPDSTTTLQQNIQIRKNDSGLTITQNPITSLDNQTQTTSTIVYLDGNMDYINVSAYTSATGGQTINGGNGTYVTIKLL